MYKLGKSNIKEKIIFIILSDDPVLQKLKVKNSN